MMKYLKNTCHSEGSDMKKNPPSQNEIVILSGAQRNEEPPANLYLLTGDSSLRCASFRMTVVLLCIGATLLLSSNIYAQKNNVQSAANSLKYDELTNAKKYIDLAHKHPKTSNDPKMWYYRGRTYLAIFSDDKTPFEKIDANAVEKSIESFINCLNVDDRKLYSDSAKYYLMNAAIKGFYEGNKFQQNKKYDKSLSIYNKILKVLPFDKKKDLIRNNVSEKTLYLYSFYAANALKDNDKAKSFLQKLIDLNYNDPKIYVFMSQILLEEKDTARALKYIELGRDNFDDNINLIKEEVKLYLMLDKSDILLGKLNEALELDPENNILYFVRGNLYQKKSNFAEAERDYKQAVELDPAYFIANYDLGTLYFNKGSDIINAAKDIVSNTAYAKEKDKADVKFKQAIPCFEAAHQIKPEDAYTIQKLKLLYARTGDTEKYEQMKKKLGELGETKNKK